MKYSGDLGLRSILEVEEPVGVKSECFKLYDLKKNEWIEKRITDCFPCFLDLMAYTRYQWRLFNVALEKRANLALWK